MLKKKTAIIISGDRAKHILHYYIRHSDDSENFSCTMYNVGIKLDDVVSEIKDLSPFLDDAEYSQNPKVEGMSRILCKLQNGNIIQMIFCRGASSGLLP